MMEKKEVYICQQQPNFEEDEIDLRELFQTIWKYKKFVVVFSFVITLLAGIYAFTKKPIYQIESFVEIGYYNSNSNSNRVYFIDPNSALIMIENEYKFKDKIPTLNSIKFKKGTHFLDIKIDAYSNQESKEFLNKIIEFLSQKEKDKLDLLINNNNLKIKNLISYKKVLKQQLNEFKEKLKVEKDHVIYQALLENINHLNDKIFNLTSQIEHLKMEISPLNISRTHIIGKIVENDYPIKPKKKLIVIVAFITSFILAIFLVFFIEFIKSSKEEEKK